MLLLHKIFTFILRPFNHKGAKMELYKLTRGTMDERQTPKLPIHLELGFGLLHVDSCMTIDCFRASLSKNKVQVAIHSYGQATGKKFKTHSTLDDDDCITVKRIK